MIVARGWGQRGCCLVGGYRLGREDVRRRMAALLGFGTEKERQARLGCEWQRARSACKHDKRKRGWRALGGGDGVAGVVGGGARSGVVEKGPEVVSEDEKVCRDCNTSKTPLWRNGPAGPKTLCNACGIRYSKLRRKWGGRDSGTEPDAHGLISTPPISGVEEKASRPPAEAEEVEQQAERRRKREGVLLLIQQSGKLASTCGKEEAEAALLLMALSAGLFVHS